MGNVFVNMLAGIPNFVVAILLAILAWIVAGIVKSIIMKLGTKLKLPAQFMKVHAVKDEEKGKELLKTLASLGYFITFLLMIPGVFDRLGMTSVSAPITGMIHSILGFLPMLLGAGLVLFIGYFLSKIAREVVSGITKAVGVDKLANKFNSEAEEKSIFSDLLGNIVFALIIIPTVIMALQILELKAVADPAQAMLTKMFAAVPNILVAIIMVILGVFIAKLAAQVLEGLFVSAGVDKLAENKHFSVLFTKYKPSVMFAGIIKFVIVAIFVFQAISVLKLAILIEISNAILAYTPSVIGALLILVIGYFAATYISDFIRNISNSKFLAVTTKVIIYMFVVFMTLNQLKLAQDIVQVAFMFIIGAVALAFVISFGLGGRDFAKKQLDRVDKKIDQ